MMSAEFFMIYLDKNIPSVNEKLFFSAILSWNQDQMFACHSNPELADLFNITILSITNLMNNLIYKKYIKFFYVDNVRYIAVHPESKYTVYLQKTPKDLFALISELIEIDEAYKDTLRYAKLYHEKNYVDESNLVYFSDIKPQTRPTNT